MTSSAIRVPSMGLQFVILGPAADKIARERSALCSADSQQHFIRRSPLYVLSIHPFINTHKAAVIIKY